MKYIFCNNYISFEICLQAKVPINALIRLILDALATAMRVIAKQLKS